MPRIVIAGASGFIGRALVHRLRQKHEVIALSRFLPAQPTEKNLEWRQCDLFSLRETENALAGGEIGIYLVHSMLPSATLSQSSFYDLDLLVAENFARTAEKLNFKQIIYLGGILPQTGNLSQHLQSRLEVEQALFAHTTPVTVLRAAMIMGATGSSFQIMLRLVERLPMLVCPQWTATKNQPIHKQDVIESIVYCLNRTETFGKIFDVAGPDIISYRQMMQQTANALGRRRWFFSVPLFSPKLSRLWVQIFTGAPSALISPLIESLRHPMVATPQQQLEIPGHPFRSFSAALSEAVAERGSSRTSTPYAFRKSATRGQGNTVRSVQRFKLPKGKTAEWVALRYLSWLPKFIPFFLNIKVTGNVCTFSIAFVHKPLLILERSPERSDVHRQLFYIRGGILARANAQGNGGRLEFREALNGKFILAAIHDFRPTLPWFIYRFTQALFHAWIMDRFGHYLANWHDDKLKPGA